MILQPGDWRGRGSFRRTDESLTTAFRARVQVAKDPVDADGKNHIVEVELDFDGDEKRVVTVWLLADGFGTYAVSARGGGFDMAGTAKIESEPHLAMLWNDDDRHVACSLFTLPESLGFRGFAKSKDGMWTWELALRPAHLAAQTRKPLPKAVGNVVSLMSRRKRR